MGMHLNNYAHMQLPVHHFFHVVHTVESQSLLVNVSVQYFLGYLNTFVNQLTQVCSDK